MSDLFHHLPGNPPPQNAVAGFFVSRDRRNIRYARFAATGRPLHGTVVLLHGRNEVIEKYFETIRDLQARGLGVATLDWRGQGGSDRLIRDPRRGYVRSFDDYAMDLEQFMQEIVLPDCRGPFYVLAHSTGALVALLASPNLVNRIQRMVCVAPLMAIEGLPISTAALRRLTGLLCSLGLGKRYLAGRRLEAEPFSLNKLTSDRARFERNLLLFETYPNLGLGPPTIAWAHAACIAAETVADPDFMARLRIPTLLVAAGADQVVSTRAVEDYAQRLRSGSLLTIDGARHEIMQEADAYREPFLAAFNAFVPGTGG